MTRGHKVLDEKRGRLPFSSTHKGIEVDSDTAKLKARNELINLIEEIESYTGFVKSSINELGKIDGRKYNAKELKKRFGLISHENELGDFGDILKMFGLAMQLTTIDEVSKELYVLKRKVMSEGVSEQVIIKLSAQLYRTTECAEKIITNYNHIDHSISIKLAEENNNILKKIAKSFTSICNRVKSLFGFHKDLQREILQDLQTMQTRARDVLAPKLRS